MQPTVTITVKNSKLVVTATSQCSDREDSDVAVDVYTDVSDATVRITNNAVIVVNDGQMTLSMPLVTR